MLKQAKNHPIHQLQRTPQAVNRHENQILLLEFFFIIFFYPSFIPSSLYIKKLVVLDKNNDEMALSSTTSNVVVANPIRQRLNGFRRFSKIVNNKRKKFFVFILCLALYFWTYYPLLIT